MLKLSARAAAIAVSSAAAIIGGTVAAAAASASPASATRPAQAPSDAGAAAPAGWQTLHDDTGLLTVAAPTEWVDVDTVPWVDDAGVEIPYVAAASSLDDFNEVFSASGVAVTALAATTDFQLVLDEQSRGECGDAEPVGVPFSYTEFTGWQEYQECDGTDYYLIAANAASNPSVSLLIEIGVGPDEDDETFYGLLDSLQVAPESAATAVPSYMMIADDIGDLSVSIPADWVVETTAPEQRQDGVAYPTIVASGPDGSMSFTTGPADRAFVPENPQCIPNAECAVETEVDAFERDGFVGYHVGPVRTVALGSRRPYRRESARARRRLPVHGHR